MSEKIPENSEQDFNPSEEEELSEDELTDIEMDQVSGGRIPPEFIQFPPEFLQRMKPQWIQRL